VEPGWRVLSSGTTSWICCDALAGIAGVVHAFHTRHPPSCVVPPVVLRQVHGDLVHRVTGPSATTHPPDGDGLVALREEAGAVRLAVRTADCIPVLLADRAGRAVAAIHAGWRGVAAGVVLRATDSLGALGVAAGALVAALGPGIGPCCYEVGEEVLEGVARAAGVAPERVSDAPARPGGGRRLDLHAALALQLAGAGVPGEAVHRAPWCTSCSPELLHSYRRDGARSGRQMACIGWGPRADA